MNIFNKIDLGSLADKSCNTEDGGPNVHHQCTFPFIWKGQKHFHCSHSNTPSWENEKCKRLIERHPNIFENDVATFKFGCRRLMMLVVVSS